MVSSPKPPDPYKTAAAQGAANREAAEASSIIGNVNERNPYGSVTYNKIGEEMVAGKPTSRYERVTSLSPEQQQLLELSNATQTNLGELGVSQSEKLQGLLGTSLDTKGLPAWQAYARGPNLQSSFGGNNPLTMQLGNAGDIQRGVAGGAVRQDQGPTDRGAIEQAMLSRYRENAGRERSAEEASLAARGLSPGSEQYSTVQDARGRQDVDAYNQAYLASGAESRAAQDAFNRAQGQRFGEGVTQGQFANQAQQQQFEQMVAEGAFENAAQAEAYRQAQERAGFANTAEQQEYVNAKARTDAENARRGLMLGERQTLRNAPINEISALMSGSQVTVPQFQGYNSPSVASVPIGQYITDNYNIRAQNAAAQNQGLFGLGGAALKMFSFGGG